MHAPEVARDHYWKSWSVPWEGAAVVAYRDDTPDLRPIPDRRARADRCRARARIPASAVVPIQITGDPASRFSLVVLGDGYTAAEQAKFRAHLDKHLNILWSIEPFRSYRNYFNVYAVEIVVAAVGHRLRSRRSASAGRRRCSLRFGGGCTNINARGVTVPQTAQAIVQQYATRATPAPSQILIIAQQRHLRRHRRSLGDDHRRQRTQPAHHAARARALARRAWRRIHLQRAREAGGAYRAPSRTRFT